jgi:hypothetical protein
MAGDQTLSYVEHDVYNIAERIRQIDSNLRLVLHEGHERPWVVLEVGPDGQERFVSRYEELDARIIDHLLYMLKVPFEERLARLDREIEAANAGFGRMTEEQFERFARDFFDAGVKSNIINPKWGRYPMSPRKMKKKAKRNDV